MIYQPRLNGAIIWERIVSATVWGNAISATASVLCLCKQEGHIQFVVKFLETNIHYTAAVSWSTVGNRRIDLD